MKTYGLSFLSSDLEKKYQETNMKSNISVLRINLCFYQLIAIVVSVFAFVNGTIVLAILGSIYVALIPFMFYMAKKNNLNFDFFCCAF